MRVSGVVMPVFSLPSDFGIGTLGKDACEFIDFLQAAQVRIWEMPPIHPVDNSFSPYSPVSLYAGNPLLIDLQPFIEQGVFTNKEIARMDWGRDRAKVSWQKVAEGKVRVLERVFEALYNAEDTDFIQFCRQNDYWLEDYCRFAAIREYFRFLPLPLWPAAIVGRAKTDMAQLCQLLEVRIQFYKYLQYLFFIQWQQLRRYASSRGIKLLGECPWKVPENSADCWVSPQTERQRQEQPGDYWLPWLEWGGQLYDIIKVYHCTEAGAAYTYHYPDSQAPEEFIQALERMQQGEECSRAQVFQRAFGAAAAPFHKPHWYSRDTVAYLGTATDDTVRGWIKALEKQPAQDLNDYIGSTLSRDQAWSMLRALWASPAGTVIAPVQDFLELGSSSRFFGFENPADNWSWRLRRGSLTNRLAQRIARMNQLFDRN